MTKTTDQSTCVHDAVDKSLPKIPEYPLHFSLKHRYVLSNKTGYFCFIWPSIS